MIQLAKKTSSVEQEPAWICGKNTSKTRLWPWKKRWNAWRIHIRVGIWFHSVSLPVFVVAMACSIAGARILQEMWEGAHWEGVWPCLDPWDVVRLRTSSSNWNYPRKYGPHSELFFFLIRKGPGALAQAVQFKPSVSTKTIKTFALIGLHLLAVEDGAGSSGSQSPDLRNMCKCGCPESPDWDSDVESWTDSEGTSSSEHCEHIVECLALNVLGQDQSGEKISLPGRLGSCECDFEPSHCSGYVVPGNA